MLRQFLRFVSILTPVFPCASLYGQTQGEMTGEVTDPSGALMPGVSITVTNEGTNAIRQMLTNANGAYSFPSLLPGSSSRYRAPPCPARRLEPSRLQQRT